MRRNRRFQQLSAKRKDDIYWEQKYITSIVKYWPKIVEYCTHHTMIHLDIRSFSLNKLSRCSSWKFVDDENNRMGGNPPKRPEKRNYEIELVDDVIDNVPGSTQRILDLVENDKKQIKLIGKDLTDLLLRRADGIR